MPTEPYFRLCQECHRFFYSKREFLLHPCNGDSQRQIDVDSLIPDAQEQEQESDPEPLPNPQPTADERQTTQRGLRIRYLAFLRKKGIRMAGERSFRKIETAYLANGGTPIQGKEA